MLLGLIVEWGGTGAINSGIGTPYTPLTPTYYFGKGFGDLPDSRVAARLRGDRADRLSDPDPLVRCRAERIHPAGAGLGGSIQYSMPYLKSEIQDLQLPDFINHLIPIVEAQISTPVANNFGNSASPPAPSIRA